MDDAVKTYFAVVDEKTAAIKEEAQRLEALRADRNHAMACLHLLGVSWAAIGAAAGMSEGTARRAWDLAGDKAKQSISEGS